MSQGPFVADSTWRLETPPPRCAPARLVAAILVALAIELVVFVVVWLERGYQPPPEVEEIPVEIIVEKPTPTPTPQAPAPESQPQEYLKPATDAPREGKSDHDDEHVADKEKPANAAPPPPAPTPSPEASQPAAAPPSPAPELPQAAEAEAPPPEKAEPIPTPPPTPDKAHPVQKPAPPNPAVLAALPKVFDSVPDVDFGGAAIRSPVTGGSAKSNYLSQLYGLVVPRLQVPAIAHAFGRRLTGAIAIEVDGRGRLIQRFVVEPSGSMELDEAAMRAVAAASRFFPAPPHSQPLSAKFTYSVD
jgi:TonB family protein